MLDSYFFIPGDKEKFIAKMDVLQADFFVIDLEDAVSKSKKLEAFEKVIQLEIESNVFVRVPLFDDHYTNKQHQKLINHFEGRVVLPKLDTKDDFEYFYKIGESISKLQTIILVESPACFIHLKEILLKYHPYIHGIGFGSHDFCTKMEMKHELKNLIHYKKELILLAKAFNKKYIDTVDLNLKDLTVFKDECVFAFENGADGKFLIHPQQIDEMRDIEYLSNEEKQKVNQLYNEINKMNLNEVDVIEIDGEYYEMPHILRIKRLYERLNK